MLENITGPYDIRGTHTQLTPHTIKAIAHAWTKTQNHTHILLGHDARTNSPQLAHAFTQGANSGGAKVTHLGLTSTDMVYYASGAKHLPAAMITASHNPAHYNGVKLCNPGAVPFWQQNGLTQVIQHAETLLDNPPPPVTENIQTENITAEYATHILNLVTLKHTKPLKIVIDAGNAVASIPVEAIFQHFPHVDIIPLHFTPDGTFPNHDPDPLNPDNLKDLQNAVTQHRADIGLAFDGDADRCFIIDEKGNPVTPSAIGCLVVTQLLQHNPHETVLHNLITSKVVPDTITKLGGTPIRTPVGHSVIKTLMHTSKAIFGVEHSGHYYFRDFWNADSGLLAALHVLKILGESKHPLSRLVTDKYSHSGELNTRVKNPQNVLNTLLTLYPTADTLDGVTVTGKNYWWNVRPSNTEPLIRLNVEATTPKLVTRHRDKLLDLIVTAGS
jgi:phosphomannomutase